jgi:Neisseria PilC beta-propeller domain
MLKLTMKSPLVIVIALLLLAAGIKYTMAITGFTPGLQPVGYVGQDEVTNYDLRSGNETVYRSDYQREFWSGNLFAYPVDASGVVNIGAERWSAGVAEQIQNQPFNSRLIATMKDDGTPIPFQWSSLSDAQKSMLTTAVGTSTVVDFLRGDRTNEKPYGAAIFRPRASALGDIIHSRPYYVFDDANPTVFVGANDGMLHAFDASSGRERWAYIPSMLIHKMRNLSIDPYEHDYFVDGQITIGNVSSGTGAGATIKRVLFGSLGAGGKGIYALDITGSTGLGATSESDVANKVLWEITPTTITISSQNPTTSRDYENLGYTYSTAIPAKITNSGVSTDVIVFGNGYNDGGDYQAYLFVANANNGRLIRAIPAGSSGTAGSPNGLFKARVIDTNGDGMADIAYAGDLNGTMWKFDLSTNSAAVAVYTTAPQQAITGTPGVALHPKGGYMINFGTGAMFTDSDANSNAVHYVYGIWDNAPTGSTKIVTQTLAEHTATFSATEVDIRVRTVSNNTVTWTTDSTSAKGWKVALPAGERLLGEGSFIQSGRFYFSAHNPTVSTVVGATGSVIKGSNWLMELDYLTGGTKNFPFFDLNGDLKLDGFDRLKNPLGSAIATTDGIPVGKYINKGVMSQPILVQLITLNNTLFNINPDLLVTHPSVAAVTTTTTTTPPTTTTTTTPPTTTTTTTPPTTTTTTTTVTVVSPGVAGGHFDQDVYYVIGGNTCTSKCQSTNHVHQYDDKYDVTGVNMLNASNVVDNLANAIPSTATTFKVLAQNQYLNPAVKLNIGNPNYSPDVDFGYVRIKDYATSATLDLANITTYTRNTIGSLAINMPVNALTSLDWWGNGDVRAGLHPTVTGCVKAAAGANDGNMYQPVIPPPNGTNGPGVKGWSGTSTPATASGVRHNGALVIQIIKSATPNSAIEQSVPGRPEYGWRVKSAMFSTYVLAEYTTFWHHPNGKCYGDAGWTKTPGPDTGSSSAITRAPGSTDPRIGSLGSGTSTSVVSIVTTTRTTSITPTSTTTTTTTPATTTTTTATPATTTTTTTTAASTTTTSTTATSNTTTNTTSTTNINTRTSTLSANGHVRTQTITYTDGTTSITETITNGDLKTITRTDRFGVRTSNTEANTDSSGGQGATESSNRSRTGRISWQELIKP